MATPAKNRICLWYDRDAEASARFYANTFPGIIIDAVHYVPADVLSGTQGECLG